MSMTMVISAWKLTQVYVLCDEYKHKIFLIVSKICSCLEKSVFIP